MDKTSKSLLAIICVLLLALISGLYVFIKSASREKTNEKPVAAPVLTLVKDTISYHSKTLPPFQHAYLIKPDSLQQANQVDSANFYYQKAARQFEKEANWEGYVWALNQVGNNYIQKQEYKEALPYLNKCLEKGLQYLGNIHPLVANTYFFLGEHYSYLNQAETSLLNFQKSLSIRKKIFGEENTHVAHCYDALGEVHRYIRLDYVAAEEYYNKALKIRENMGDKNSYELAINYYNLATTNRLKGDLDKALSYGFQTVDLVESFFRKDVAFLEKCYSMLANIHYSKTQYNKAITYLNRAISLNIENDTQPLDLAYYYNDLGKAYGSLEKHETSVQHYKRALYILLHNPFLDSLGIADSYLFLGDTYKKLGQFNASLVHFKKGLQIRLAYFGKRHWETSNAYLQIGNLYAEKNLLDTALIYYQRAIIAGTQTFDNTDIFSNPAIEDIGKNYPVFNTLAYKAKALKTYYYSSEASQKSLFTALHCYQLADTLMQLHRRSYNSEDSKLFFTGNHQNIYEDAISCVFLLYQLTGSYEYCEQAFRFMEKSKAGLLFETLKEVEAISQANIPDSLRELERNLKIDMALYQQQLEEINKVNTDETQQQQLRAQIFNIGRQQEKLMEHFANAYPNYFQIKYVNHTLNLYDLQAFSRQADKQIIEYFWGDHVIYAVSISSDSVKLIKVNKTEKLVQAISTYLQLSSQKPGLTEADNDFNLFTQSAYFLYRTLVEPLIDKKETLYAASNNLAYQQLIIIPDGPLTSIPFESLISALPATNKTNYRDLNYLIYRFYMSYAFSAHLLLFKNKKEHTEAGKHSGLLAFSYSDHHLKNQDTDELAGSARELQAIASHMEGIFFQGEQATESAFKKLAPQFSILHLAIHGKAGQKSYLSNHLLFKHTQNEPEDGLLYPYELYNLYLQAKLTVLSACETGVGKLFKGEGVYSIARGFAYAGCPAIVMSLWKANDQTTADVMGEFYKGLSAGLEIDKSLHHAKMAYLTGQDEITAHPVYWAAFVPLGNMAPVVAENTSIYWIAGGTGVFLIILTLLINLCYSMTKHRHVK